MYCLIGFSLIKSTKITATALYICFTNLLYKFDEKFKLEVGFLSLSETFSS